MLTMPVLLFFFFVAIVLFISFYLGKNANSSSNYFAAGGHIHYGVNGIAFAGDYLSAASFLGICGMIATVGYDGFLYSIGYLAGWIVALFVVAEPIKRLGKFTFTDALDAKFNNRGIKFTAALSTLIVSIFYLIPQMVGAGSLVTPLLGIPHHWGVIMVGGVVIIIVATAGMASTTWVQFIKGGLLVLFSTILSISIFVRGLETKPDQGGKVPFYEYQRIEVIQSDDAVGFAPADPEYSIRDYREVDGFRMAKLFEGETGRGWWVLRQTGDSWSLEETQCVYKRYDGGVMINGKAADADNQLRQVGDLVSIAGSTEPTGSIGPFRFLAILGNEETVVKQWKKIRIREEMDYVDVYVPYYSPGNRIMRPGIKFKVEGTPIQRMEFISLMLALFFGTAALPHILIRYYTVKDPAAARKSTIVAIAAIGFFYILTLFMGLGAMTNGVINLADSNMSAPLLARSFGVFLFSIISAIAFATVLGTVSGLIVAASGAIAHDIMDRFAGLNMTDRQKVDMGRLAALSVGLIAIILGIIFKGMNVSFLVGWAFAVAASANLPAILMLLFWKKTTAQGISSSIVVGIVAALGIILLSPDMFVRYGLPAASAPIPFSQPGIISIPLSFLTLITVSLMTQKKVTS